MCGVERKWYRLVRCKSQNKSPKAPVTNTFRAFSVATILGGAATDYYHQADYVNPHQSVATAQNARSTRSLHEQIFELELRGFTQPHAMIPIEILDGLAWVSTVCWLNSREVQKGTRQCGPHK